jgi:hypothetical protein
MNILNMPGFTAEASLYGRIRHYQADTTSVGIGQGREVCPARPMIYRTMKGFCVDFSVFGGPQFCCNSDGECGPEGEVFY